MTCSIVIPCKNAMPHLRAALSAAVQIADEVIVVDNSTDGSYDLAVNFAKQYKNLTVFQVADTPTSTASFGRNFGFSRVTSDYTIFLDADDLLFPDVVRSHLRQIHQRQADVLLSSYIKLNYRYTPPDAVLMDIDEKSILLSNGTTRCVTSFFIYRTASIANVPWSEVLHADQQLLLDLIAYNLQAGTKTVATFGKCPAGYYRAGWAASQISNAVLSAHDMASQRILTQYNELVGGSDAVICR